MYEVSDIQDYKKKWLEAERDLAMNWVETIFTPLNCEPMDNIDEDTEPISKVPQASRILEGEHR